MGSHYSTSLVFNIEETFAETVSSDLFHKFRPELFCLVSNWFSFLVFVLLVAEDEACGDSEWFHFSEKN